MDHNEAVRLHAAEKYLLGELPEAQREEYEEHYFDCAECAEELKASVAFAEGARQVFREEARERIAARDNDRVSEGWFAWLRPALAIPVFAALLLLIGYQNTLVIPGLKQASSHALTAKLVKSFSLLQVRAPRAGSLTIGVTPAEGFVLDVDLPPAKTSEGYVCEVQDKAGRTQFALPVSTDGAKRTVHVSVPGGLLRPGKYDFVVLSGQAPNTPTDKRNEVERLPFTVEFSE